jgi:CRISPR-associated endonuclease/helicase Cas3
LAAEFARPWGAAALAAALGLFHDAGKASCGWQEALGIAEAADHRAVRRGSRRHRVGVDHKELGARLLAGVADYTAMAILGHHGGLDTFAGLRGLLRSAPADDAEVTTRRFYREVPEARRIAENRSSLVPQEWRRDRLVGELGLRMVFSALVDADRLDTARHRYDLDAPQVAAPADMGLLFDRFERGRRKILSDPGRKPARMDPVREAVYQEVLVAAEQKPGIYRLPAPTGSGKTFAQMGFALAHAARHEMRRVIVAMPYITVTEQNAGLYRSMLDTPSENVVLEHHSQALMDGSRSGGWAKLAAENWDAPVVVTTTVQLFESLFGRNPEQMRKVHRLANAVIVLDEVQALPPRLLVPILDVLKTLVSHFGATVLLTTATQPAFETLQPWQAIGRPPSIIADPAELFRKCRRVRYRWEADRPVTVKALAARLAGRRQALVVVNTTRDARRLSRILASKHHAVLHLSTRMCPLHRQAVLATVRDHLHHDRPVLLVSTQLIETGVDVDFPVVFRELGPAESIHQAAGRANRGGNRPSGGTVVVFALRDGTPPPQAYRVPVDQTVERFAGDAIDGVEEPDEFTAYCAQVYDQLGLSNLTAADHGLLPVGLRVQALRRDLDFPGVDRLFRMIEDEDTTPVVVPYGNAEQRGELQKLLDQVRGGTPRMEHLRRIQPWAVSLPVKEVAAARAAGVVRDLAGTLLEWTGAYDELVGADPDPERPEPAAAKR